MSSGKYDTDVPEGSKGYTSQYATKKDAIVVGIVIIILALILIPVFKKLKAERDIAVCKKNLKGIGTAMLQYSESYDGRFPPVYEPGQGLPPSRASDNNGIPVVWASVISQFMPNGSSFTCPACDPKEAVKVNGFELKESISAEKVKTQNHLDLTYGMYLALSAKPRDQLAREEETILIAETSNAGAKDVYNPIPFRDRMGATIPYDGFLIGYDNSNDTYDANTSFVTRLSFYGTNKGDFSNKDGRHKKVIHVLYADSHVGAITSEEAFVQNQQGGSLSGKWSSR